MKTTVHIISHSHWDREWYQSFEKHRMKLIELVDNILEKAENDPEFGGFFLDGQTIALDDYLEVRPEKREQVEKCVREGKIQTGPWYILQDECPQSSGRHAGSSALRSDRKCRLFPGCIRKCGTDAAGAEAGGHGCGCVRTRRKTDRTE